MTLEFRHRSKRVPRDLFSSGEVRIRVGNKTQRDCLKSLTKIDHWDTLYAIKRGYRTVDGIVALIKTHGFDHYQDALRQLVTGPTLGAAVEEYLEHKPLGDGTRVVYRHHLRRLLKLVGPLTPLLDLGSDQINMHVAAMERRGLAAGTRHKWMVAGSSMWTWHMQRDLAAARREKRRPLFGHHPFREAEAVPTPPTRHRFLSWEEYLHLLDVVDEPLRAIYATGVWAALRPGELISLPPEHVLLPRVIRIAPFGTWTPKGWPKHTGSVGDVPIHRRHLLPLLEEYAATKAGSETFFVNPRTGNRWRYRAWLGQVERDVTKAGLEFGRGGPRGILPHTLRHTVPSWMAQGDVQLMKIAQFLRDTVRTTERHYAHLLPSDLDETIQGMR